MKDDARTEGSACQACNDELLSSDEGILKLDDPTTQNRNYKISNWTGKPQGQPVRSKIL
jgi:hypothetical protein